MHRTFGYARVSSKDQNEGRQVEAFRELGIDERDIFIDKASGKDFDRPKYEALTNVLRSGDLLYIKSIDRLGRDYEEIQNQWRFLTKELGIDIVVIDMPLLDTRTHKNLLGTFISDLVLQVLSFMAEQERTHIRQRQAEGIALAKAQGKQFGRKPIPLPKNFPEVYDEWQSGDITAVRARELLGLKNTTFYKLVAEFEETYNFGRVPMAKTATPKNKSKLIPLSAQNDAQTAPTPVCGTDGKNKSFNASGVARMSETSKYATLLEKHNGDYARNSKMNEFITYLKHLVFELRLSENVKGNKELEDTVILHDGRRGYETLMLSIAHLKGRVAEIYKEIFASDIESENLLT